jgi:histidinol-phosphate/aromatic aminotransferase/cobyric acid decarboxylase-like protein
MEWLQSGGSAVRDYVERIRVERTELARTLRALGVQAPESQTNFVFARFANAETVWRALAERGIAVRRFPSAPELMDALRITCPGNERDFARLTTALHEIAASENRSS